ncbi:MAG: DUF2911 domain-containing protein [Myxococcota bacterium]
MLAVLVSFVACGLLPGSELPPPDSAFEAIAIPSRGSDATRSSKNGHLAHTVDGVRIDVRYGRPEVRGRTILGNVVPFGDVWRTGADEATTIAFASPVEVNGAPLDPGVYALFSIPYRGEWVVILNEQAEQWGAYGYSAAKDAVRLAVKAETGPHTEQLTIEGTATGLRVRWADFALPLTVEAPTE